MADMKADVDAHLWSLLMKLLLREEKLSRDEYSQTGL
jgi:hypothetical protein